MFRKEIPEELIKLNERFENEFNLVIYEKINLLKKEIDILNLTIDRLKNLAKSDFSYFYKKESVEAYLKQLQEWRDLLLHPSL
ncbi:hypothetical protein BKH41_03675 [Helicobacter sp. 12S02232-10]|nr:hypothetical protein BKH41_03675 [Helicobacter sp. 12S02232-10]